MMDTQDRPAAKRQAKNTVKGIRYNQVRRNVYEAWLDGVRLGVVGWSDQHECTVIFEPKGHTELFKHRWQAAEALVAARRTGGEVAVQVRAGSGVARERVVIKGARETRSVVVALSRLVRKLGGELIGQGGGRYTVTLRGVDLDGRPAPLLARLVRIAVTPLKFKGFGLTLDQVRATLGLVRLPSNVAGWELNVLKAVRSLVAEG
jgi:hypothetical protein